MRCCPEWERAICLGRNHGLHDDDATDGLQNAYLQSNTIEPSRHMSRRHMYICMYVWRGGGRAGLCCNLQFAIIMSDTCMYVVVGPDML